MKEEKQKIVEILQKHPSDMTTDEFIIFLRIKNKEKTKTSEILNG